MWLAGVVVAVAPVTPAHTDARHDDVGEPFDPSQHEAVAVADEPEAEPGTVVRVVRPGYGDEDNQLRPAAVVVAAGDR